MQWLDPDPGPHPLATDDGRVTLAWSHSGHQLMVHTLHSGHSGHHGPASPGTVTVCHCVHTDHGYTGENKTFSKLPAQCIIFVGMHDDKCRN